MLNVSSKRLEKTYRFNLLSESGREFDGVFIEHYPLHSKAHRDSQAELLRLEIDVKDTEKAYPVIAAYLMCGQEGLDDDGEPIDCSDKEKLIEILAGETSIIMQILANAEKKHRTPASASNSTQES